MALEISCKTFLPHLHAGHSGSTIFPGACPSERPQMGRAPQIDFTPFYFQNVKAPGRRPATTPRRRPKGSNSGNPITHFYTHPFIRSLISRPQQQRKGYSSAPDGTVMRSALRRRTAGSRVVNLIIRIIIANCQTQLRERARVEQGRIGR